MNGVRPRGIVFDLDGVLIDSRSVMRAAFYAAYATVVGTGEAPFDEYLKYQGWLFSDIMSAMGLPAAMESPFVEESERRLNEIEVYEGVVVLLEELRRRNVGVAVATGKVRRRADATLGATGLASLVDVVVGSDEVRAGKPAPDIFVEAVRRLGVDVKHAFSIGDAVADVVASRAAGMAVAAATWGETARDELLASAPDLVLEHPLDVLAHCGDA